VVAAVTIVAAALLSAPAAICAPPNVTATQVQSDDRIGISGSGFGTTTGTVLFNGSQAVILSWSDSAIQITNPFVDNLVTSQVVLITASGQKATGAAYNQQPVLSTSAAERDNRIHILNVGFNGKGNQAHVSPGGTLIVLFDYAAAVLQTAL
jgi:hypothetical protein